MSNSIQWRPALAIGTALALCACNLTPQKSDTTPPVFRLTVHDNAANQNTVLAQNTPATPFLLKPGYDVLITVVGSDAESGMSEMSVYLSHYQVNCSVKPDGPKSDKPENYSIDSNIATAAKQADGKVPSQMAYIKAVKSAEIDKRYCATISKSGAIYYPTVDAGGLLNIHAFAKNAAGAPDGGQADWYLRRP